MALNKVVKCPHCWAENTLKYKEISIVKMDGKAVRKCSDCGKLFTVRETEEGELFSTR